ncbi:MAG TPA: hypothetical protein V6D13_09740 [Halomicronema sp.]
MEVPASGKHKAQLELQRLIDESASQVAVTFLSQSSEGLSVVKTWVYPETQQEESLNGLLLVKRLAIINRKTIGLCLNQGVFERKTK